MKAAVLHSYDEKLTAREFVKYEDVAETRISRPSEVIIRIGGAGVSRTDLHIVEGIWRSKVDVKSPLHHGPRKRRMGRGRTRQRRRGREGWRCGHLPSARHQRPLSGLSAWRRHARGGQQLSRHQRERRLRGISADRPASLIKFPKTFAPKDVAPYTDAGLTAYRAAKKASRHLLPGEYAVVIGAAARAYRDSGAGALCAAEIIVVDRAEGSLELAKECGAHHMVKAGADEVEAVLRAVRSRRARALKR